MINARQILVFLLLFLTRTLGAQNAVEEFLKPSDSLDKDRRTAVLLVGAAGATGTFVALNQFWYSDYPKTNFHFTNDNAEWLQMDKAGHAFAAYHLSHFSANSLQWSGVSDRESILYGAAAGFLLISAVEVFDGFSSNWGASAGDLAANAGGTALFVSQHFLWNEQRIVPKFSFHFTPYASARPNVLGTTATQQILKDYNGQTYWLSANVRSFFKESPIPEWLNIAIGYGAEGMITGDDDIVNSLFLPEKRRFRQYYLSLDADLTRIKTKSHVLKTVFSVINTIKIPAPTLEFTGTGKVKLHALYF